MKGIKVCSKKGPCPFPRGDNYEIAKIHWQNLKIFSSRTTVPISTKLQLQNHKASFGEGDSSLFKWKKIIIKLIMFISSLDQCYDIIICVYWFELFSQVSDVAHVPLVLICLRPISRWQSLLYTCIFVRVFSLFIGRLSGCTLVTSLQRNWIPWDILCQNGVWTGCSYNLSALL